MKQISTFFIQLTKIPFALLFPLPGRDHFSINNSDKQ